MEPLRQRGLRQTQRVIWETVHTIRSPISVGGLILWLDASDASSIVLAGSGVSKMFDKSPNGIILTQTIAGKRPTQVVAGQNGLNTIRFTAASSQTLTFNKAINYGGDSTYIVIFRRSAGATKGFVVGFTTASPYNNFYENDDNVYFIVQNSILRYYTPAVDTNYNLFSSRISDPVQTANYNRVTKALGTGATAGMGTTIDNLGFMNGSYSDATFAELFVYNRSLTDADIAYLENYLHDKWATP